MFIAFLGRYACSWCEGVMEVAGRENPPSLLEMLSFNSNTKEVELWQVKEVGCSKVRIGGRSG